MNKKILVLLLINICISSAIPFGCRNYRKERWSDIQLHFRDLQESLGINNPPPKGKLGGDARPRQAQLKALNDARTKLYDLLTQPTRAIDVPKIQQAIIDLEKLQPRYWPQPNDYRDVLSVMLGQKSAAQVSI